MFTKIVLVIQIKMSEIKNVLFQEPMRFIKSISDVSISLYLTAICSTCKKKRQKDINSYHKNLTRFQPNI